MTFLSCVILSVAKNLTQLSANSVTEESAVRINSAKNFNNEISFKRKYRFFAPWAQNDKNAWLGFKAKYFWFG